MPKPSIMACAVSRTDMMSLTWHPLALGRAQALEGGGLQFLGVADHGIDLGHGGEALGLDLCGAAGDDDARGRVVAAQLADRLRRLAHGLAGDGAGVDDDAFASPAAIACRRITSNS